MDYRLPVLPRCDCGRDAHHQHQVRIRDASDRLRWITLVLCHRCMALEQYMQCFGTASGFVYSEPVHA